MDNGIPRKRPGEELPRRDDRRCHSAHDGGGGRGCSGGSNEELPRRDDRSCQPQFVWGRQVRSDHGGGGYRGGSGGKTYGNQGQAGADQQEQKLSATPEQLGQLQEGAVASTLQYLEAEWAQKEGQRIRRQLAARLAVDDEDDDEGSEGSWEPARDFSDVLPPAVDETVNVLPLWYRTFTIKLPTCNLPLQKHRDCRRCYCPLSRKAFPWRKLSDLTEDERYVPVCNNGKLLQDQGLKDHLRTGWEDEDRIDWHQIVSKYNEFLLQGYDKMGFGHDKAV